MSGLINSDYNVPSSGESSYMKFKKDENRFRILDTPVVGYQYWQEPRVPVRIKLASEAPAGEKPKHFWQVPVWSEGQVKILDITQSTVQKQLLELDRNSEWGNLSQYDVIVNRKGDGMDTTYTTTPCPKSPMTDEMMKAYKEFKADYDPNAVFEGNAASQEDDLPF